MTAERIVSAAQAEIGVKESPANSNRVKYNTAYYGRAVLSGTAIPKPEYIRALLDRYHGKTGN